MTRDTRIALLLMGKLVAALRANDPDALRSLLSESIQELGMTEVEELLLGLAPRVPDGRRARQADGLAPRGKPLTRWGIKPAE